MKVNEVILVDRAAGVAAFRKARSLCIRLDGVLDPDTAGLVAVTIGADVTSVRLRLECSTLAAAHPDAARAVAESLLRWWGGGERVIDVLNLAPALAHSPAWRPLAAFLDPDELLFVDPDRDKLPGAAASRH